MNLVSRTLTLFVLLAASQLASSCASPPPEVQAALDAATANLATSEGQKYDSTFGAQMSPRIRTAAISCGGRLAGGIGGQTNVLYRIDSSGRPVESLVYPDTDMGYCVRDMLAGFTLPPPPFPDYWIILRLGI